MIDKTLSEPILSKMLKRQKGAIIERLEKKFYISIKDISLLSWDEEFRQVLITFDNNQTTEADFYIRMGRLVIKLTEGQVNSALVPKQHDKYFLQEMFRKYGTPIARELMTRFNRKKFDFEIIQDSEDATSGILRILYKGVLVSTTTILFRRGRIVCDIGKIAPWIESNIKEVDRKIK